MDKRELALESRRIETWKAIHDTAATLALRDGLTQTTVDSIAEVAGVSRRTFFNYFSSKEDAVLGLGPPSVTEDALEAFQEVDGDVLRGLVQLMATTLVSTTRQTPGSSVRKSLIQRFPELLARVEHHRKNVEALIAPILHEKLASAPGTDPADIEKSAKAMLMLASTIVRFTYAHHPNPSSVKVAEIDSAIETFRSLLKETQ